MKTAAIITAAVATLAPLVSAQFAVVKNLCNFTTYVTSVPYDGSPAGQLFQLPAKTGTFSEPYRPSGSSLKMGTFPQLSAPLLLGYDRTDNPALVYYELKNQFGNPFSTYRNSAIASRLGCPSTICGANDPNCYSGPGRSKVNACARPTNVTVTLCAAAAPRSAQLAAPQEFATVPIYHESV